MAILILLLWLIINVPLALRVYRSLLPFSINKEATAFTGHWAKWKITAITGRVLATRRTTTVSGGGSVSGSASSGTVSGSSYVSTSVYDNFRLKDVDGRQHDVELKNFQARVFEGDVVTVGYATKLGDSRPFVVLNHTTGVSNTNAVTIRQLSSPGDLRLVAQIFVGIFTLIGIPLLIAYVVFERRQRSHFLDAGLRPLWATTAPTAAQLPVNA